MNRQASINGINDRYINNAIIGGLASQLPPGGGYSTGFNNEMNLLPLTADTDINNVQGVPISISAAQRTISPYGLADKVGHNSRVGQIMYDEGAGVPQRAKSRLQGLNNNQQSLGWVPLILPAILLLFLFIFVITCIVKHSNNPFSENSLKYYAQHPQITSSLASSDQGFTTALLKQQINPTVKSSSFDIQQRNQISNEQIDHTPNEVLQQQQIQQNTNNTTINSPPTTEQYQGQCKQGQYLLNGICYPCRNGFWDGKKCVTKGLGSSLVSNQVLQQTSTVQNVNTDSVPSNILNTNISSTVSQSVVANPFVTNAQCKDGRPPINGQCISCPSDSIWNGNSCQRIGNHHHLRLIHLKRKL